MKRILCALAYLAALAGAGANDTLTLPELWQRVREQNPELAALRHGVDAAEAHVTAARTYPNPTLELEAEDVKLSRPSFHESVNTIAFSQPLDFGARRGGRIAAASREVAVAWAALAERERELFAELAGAWVELLYARQARALYDALLFELREPLEISRRRVEARAAPRWEVERTRLEIEQLRQEAAALPAREGAARAVLSRLAGETIPFEVAGEPAAPQLPDASRLLDHVLATHPRVIAALSEIDAAGARARLERLRVWAPPAVRIAAGRNTAEGENILEAGIAIPLPLWNRNQGMIAAAEAHVGMQQSELAAVRDALRAEVETALVRHAAARERLEAMDARLLPLATEIQDLTRTGYQVGKQSYLDWLSAQEALFAARRLRLELLHEQSRAAAELSALAGISPPLLTEGEQP